MNLRNILRVMVAASCLTSWTISFATTYNCEVTQFNAGQIIQGCFNDPIDGTCEGGCYKSIDVEYFRWCVPSYCNYCIYSQMWLNMTCTQTPCISGVGINHSTCKCSDTYGDLQSRRVQIWNC